MRRALLLAVVALLAFPAAGWAKVRPVKTQGWTSFVPQTRIVSENPIYQEWVNRAKVRTPRVSLALVEGPCPYDFDGAPACTVYSEGTIWLPRLGWPEAEMRHLFYHELGHWMGDGEAEADRYAICAEWGKHAAPPCAPWR